MKLGSTGLVLAATSSSLLSVLKYLLLAVLWVFFILVLRAVLTEVRRPVASEAAPPRQPAAARLTGFGSRPAERRASPAAQAEPNAFGSGAPAGAPVTTGAAPSGFSEAEAAARAEWASRSDRRAQVGSLRVVEPIKERGRSFPLVDELTIGRATNCTVSIPDDSFVSSRHARVWQSDGQAWLEDLGSTNGTTLNGAPLSGRSHIGPGDRIQVGRTVLEATQ